MNLFEFCALNNIIVKMTNLPANRFYAEMEDCTIVSKPNYTLSFAENTLEGVINTLSKAISDTDIKQQTARHQIGHLGPVFKNFYVPTLDKYSAMSIKSTNVAPSYVADEIVEYEYSNGDWRKGKVTAMSNYGGRIEYTMMDLNTSSVYLLDPSKIRKMITGKNIMSNASTTKAYPKFSVGEKVEWLDYAGLWMDGEIAKVNNIDCNIKYKGLGGAWYEVDKLLHDIRPITTSTPNAYTPQISDSIEWFDLIAHRWEDGMITDIGIHDCEVTYDDPFATNCIRVDKSNIRLPINKNQFSFAVSVGDKVRWLDNRNGQLKEGKITDIGVDDCEIEYDTNPFTCDHVRLLKGEVMPPSTTNTPIFSGTFATTDNFEDKNLQVTRSNTEPMCHCNSKRYDNDYRMIHDGGCAWQVWNRANDE